MKSPQTVHVNRQILLHVNTILKNETKQNPVCVVSTTNQFKQNSEWKAIGFIIPRPASQPWLHNHMTPGTCFPGWLDLNPTPEKPSLKYQNSLECMTLN